MIPTPLPPLVRPPVMESIQVQWSAGASRWVHHTAPSRQTANSQTWRQTDTQPMQTRRPCCVLATPGADNPSGREGGFTARGQNGTHATNALNDDDDPHNCCTQLASHPRPDNDDADTGDDDGHIPHSLRRHTYAPGGAPEGELSSATFSAVWF